jgi:transglutaminase superfamily protein
MFDADAWFTTHPPLARTLRMLCDLASDEYVEDLGFRIPAHVHVCVTPDGSVLLDLKRDKYFGMGRRETLLLAAVVPEWPKPVWGGESCEVRQESEVKAGALSLCESLVSDGLLLRDVDVGSSGAESRREALGARGAAEIYRDMKGEWISIGDELEVASTVGSRDVFNFLWAYLWVRGSLALRPFAATVESMRVLKARRRDGRHAWHFHRVAAMVDVFRRLRPFIFAAEGRCLLHALTLVKFLSRYDFHPEWMIGVTTQPWGAHSWVQWGNFLLDTNPEKVCGYVPILTV